MRDISAGKYPPPARGCEVLRHEQIRLIDVAYGSLCGLTEETGRMAQLVLVVRNGHLRFVAHSELIDGDMRPIRSWAGPKAPGCLRLSCELVAEIDRRLAALCEQSAGTRRDAHLILLVSRGGLVDMWSTSLTEELSLAA